MPEHVSIGNRKIGPNEPPLVIAEIGMNHNGELDLAEQIIEKAADSGADAVKFQTYDTSQYFAPDYSDFETRVEYELKPEWHEHLMDLAAENDLLFLSTPFDNTSVNLLDDIGVPAFKIASFDVTNHHLIEHIAEKGRPIILSTGYSTHSEIAEAVEVIQSTGNNDLILLHCISQYPTPVEQMNMRAMNRLENSFNVPVGLSDHTYGTPVAPIMATTQGAAVIEKHFTIDNDLPGYDHEMSETPESLDQLTTQIQKTHQALGNGDLEPLEKEKESLPEARRTLYWKESYEKGTEIKSEMFLPLRPGGGLKVEMIPELSGNSLSQSVEQKTKVNQNQINWEEKLE